MKRNIKTVIKIDKKFNCSIFAFEKNGNQDFLIFEKNNENQINIELFIKDTFFILNNKLKTNIKQTFLFLDNDFYFESDFFSQHTLIDNSKKIINQKEIDKNLELAKATFLNNQKFIISIKPLSYTLDNDEKSIFSPLGKNAHSLNGCYLIHSTEDKELNLILDILNKLNILIKEIITYNQSINQMINEYHYNKDKRIVLNLGKNNSSFIISNNEHIFLNKEIDFSFDKLITFISEKANIKKDILSKFIKLFNNNLNLLSQNFMFSGININLEEIKKITSEFIKKVIEKEIINTAKNNELNIKDFTLLVVTDNIFSFLKELIYFDFKHKFINFNNNQVSCYKFEIKYILTGINLIEKENKSFSKNKTNSNLLHTQPYSSDELFLKTNKLFNLFYKFFNKRIKHA